MRLIECLSHLPIVKVVNEEVDEINLEAHSPQYKPELSSEEIVYVFFFSCQSSNASNSKEDGKRWFAKNIEEDRDGLPVIITVWVPIIFRLHNKSEKHSRQEGKEVNGVREF